MPFWQRSKCIYNRNMKLYTIALVALLPCLAATPDVDKGKALGLPTAPIRMEIFSDFTCPHCRLEHAETLPLLMKEFVVPGKLYIVDRAFPLNGPGHQYSREAFGYAVAAARIGKYQEVAENLHPDGRGGQPQSFAFVDIRSGRQAGQQRHQRNRVELHIPIVYAVTSLPEGHPDRTSAASS